MTLNPQRFQKRPVQIQAMQFDGTASVTDAILRWAGSQIGMLGYNQATNTCFQLTIKTLEGTMLASHGDWIIRGIQGEIYPCKPDIFEQSYDPVYDPEQDPDQLALFDREDVG